MSQIAIAINLDPITNLPVSVLLEAFRELGVQYSPHHVNCVPESLVEKAATDYEFLPPEDQIRVAIMKYEEPGTYIFTTSQGPCDYGEYYRVELDVIRLVKLIKKLDRLGEQAKRIAEERGEDWYKVFMRLVKR